MSIAVADLHTKASGPQPDPILIFFAQLSHSVLMQSVWRKPYIASLEIWMIGLWMDGLLDSCKLWTVGPLDYYNVKYQMDDYPADSCAISPTEVGAPNGKSCIHPCISNKYVSFVLN